MQLNKLIKTNKKKFVWEEALALGEGKLHQGGTKVKNRDLVYQLKALRVDKCLYIEDCLREALKV